MISYLYEKRLDILDLQIGENKTWGNTTWTNIWPCPDERLLGTGWALAMRPYPTSGPASGAELQEIRERR